MPVYHSDRFLEDAILSILHQTYPYFELIIVCSDPTDETKRILEDYQKKDSRIRVVYQEKKGIIFARNTGFTLAKGEFIAVMDADDLSHTERLETQLAYLKDHPDIGIVGSWAKIIDERGKTIKAACPPAKHAVIGWYLLFGNCMVHLTVMMRSSILKKLNGYQQKENGFPEDYDLWTRAFFVTKLANIQQFLGGYRMHTSNNSLDVSAELDRYCAIIQDSMIRRLIGEMGKLFSITMPVLDKDSVFSFTHPVNPERAEFAETLFHAYKMKFNPSKSEISEMNLRISEYLISSSLSVFQHSKSRSRVLLFKSLHYSKTAVIRKILSLISGDFKKYFYTMYY